MRFVVVSEPCSARSHSRNLHEDRRFYRHPAGHRIRIAWLGALVRPEAVLWGALDAGAECEWAPCPASAAWKVAAGRADQALISCTTGTGASIAANKIPGVRAALCSNATTAAGARRYNDANLLCVSLRLTSGPVTQEVLQAWFAAEIDPAQASNIAFVKQSDQRPG